MKQLLVATSNQGKLAEFRQALKGSMWQVITPTEINLGNLDVPETGTSFAKNAALKAKTYGEKSRLITLADDSGLKIAALDNRPGVFSARYGKTDDDRNQKVLDEMAGKTNREACFQAAIAIYDPNTKKKLTFYGRAEGKITKTPQGNQGFGYDPIFFSTDLHKTFAQASTQEKNRISHRGRALAQAIEVLHKWS